MIARLAARAAYLLVLAVGPAGADPQGLLVLIIDDMGDRPVEGDRVAALEGPVVCAFLPHTPHATRQAERCHAQDKEVMLHQPMEAKNGASLGPGGLRLDMRRDEFEAVVRANLEAIPHATAVNNHMGSLLTRHPGHMTWLMETLRDEGEFLFVDSRTSVHTVAEQMAREADLPTLRRDVFLDHHRDPEAIRSQLRRAVEQARRTGVAVAIGHPYPETLDVLEADLAGLLAAHDVRLASLGAAYDAHLYTNGTH